MGASRATMIEKHLQTSLQINRSTHPDSMRKGHGLEVVVAEVREGGQQDTE